MRYDLTSYLQQDGTIRQKCLLIAYDSSKTSRRQRGLYLRPAIFNSSVFAFLLNLISTLINSPLLHTASAIH